MKDRRSGNDRRPKPIKSNNSNTVLYYVVVALLVILVFLSLLPFVGGNVQVDTNVPQNSQTVMEGVMLSQAIDKLKDLASVAKTSQDFETSLGTLTEGASASLPIAAYTLALSAALKKSNVAIAKHLIQRYGVSALTEDVDSGLNAFHMACMLEGDQVDLVEAMLSGATDPVDSVLTSKFKDGSTGLFFAALQGNVKTASFLLSKGANPSVIGHRNMSVLMLAASLPNDAGLQLTHDLLKAGAPANVVDVNKNCALHFACLRLNEKIATTLITEGRIDVNIKGQNGLTPLMMSALSYGDGFHLTKKLLELGANLAMTDDGLHTALRYASINNNRKVADLLIERGAGEVEKVLEKGKRDIKLRQEKEKEGDYGDDELQGGEDQKSNRLNVLMSEEL